MANQDTKAELFILAILLTVALTIAYVTVSQLTVGSAMQELRPRLYKLLANGMECKVRVVLPDNFVPGETVDLQVAKIYKCKEGAPSEQ